MGLILLPAKVSQDISISGAPWNSRELRQGLCLVSSTRWHPWYLLGWRSLALRSQHPILVTISPEHAFFLLPSHAVIPLAFRTPNPSHNATPGTDPHAYCPLEMMDDMGVSCMCSHCALTDDACFSPAWFPWTSWVSVPTMHCLRAFLHTPCSCSRPCRHYTTLTCLRKVQPDGCSRPHPQVVHCSCRCAKNCNVCLQQGSILNMLNCGSPINPICTCHPEFAFTLPIRHIKAINIQRERAFNRIWPPTFVRRK